MSRQKDLLKNTLLIAVSKLSTQFLTFLLLPLYTTFLTTEEFGTVDLAITYIFLLAPLVTMQLEMAAFRFLINARSNEGRKRDIISSVVQIVCVAMICLALIVGLMSMFITIPHIYLLFATAAAVILSNILMQIARGLGSTAKFAIAGIIAGVTTVFASILFIGGLHMGVEGMLLAMALGNVFASIYLFFTLKIYYYINLWQGSFALKKKLLGYSAPLVPNGVSWWAINAADRTIIALTLGVAANGIYAVAYKFPQIFNGLFSFFGMSWTESASVYIDSPDRDRFFSQTMNASVKLFGSLGLAIIAGVPIIFPLFVRNEFDEAYLYIPILIVGAFFNSIVGLYSAIYIAKKMTRQVMNTSLISAAVNIIFTLAFIHLVGLYAAALAMAIAYLVMAVYRHYDVKKYVTISYEKSVFLTLLGLYILVIGLYYIHNPVVNVVNAVITIGLVVLFNRSIVALLVQKLRRRKTVEDVSDVQV